MEEVLFMIAKQRALLLVGVALIAAMHCSAVTSVSLIWDPSPSAQAVGYKIYCTLPDGSGKASYDVGSSTSAVVGNLMEGQTYVFYGTAYDSNQNESAPSDTLTYTVPGSTTNHPPSIASIPNQTADEGKSLQFTISATDPDQGQTLSFSLANGPAGAAINKDSGVFSWTPQPGQAPSSNTVTVVATDNGQPAQSASQTFSITVREGFYLTLNSSPYGTAQVNPRGSLNSQGTKYISGTTVSVTASPANGYKFDHWTLDGANYTQNPLSFTMNSNHTLTPYFLRGNAVYGALSLVGQ
jgi:hypothetical protein